MDEDKPTQRVSSDDDYHSNKPKQEIIFGRYELLGELGKGGMGVVWLAQDQELNTKVALKFLREEMTSEADALRELKGEVILNRDLSHANIIKTFDFVTNGRAAAISMEYVSGTNLHKMKARRPNKFFEVEDIRSWIVMLCDAMEYAHKQKVVHRDIKPANLMINDKGELKVGDFGIGRTVADTVNRVTKNYSGGTPPFMSPQQTMGEKASPHDDIYSVGATIYDLLTGDPPFFRGAIREQAIAKVPPSMALRRKELGREGLAIPPRWEGAVAACLSKDPEERPQTIAELRGMLDDGVRESSAKPKPGRYRAGPILLGCSVAAVSLAALAYWKLVEPDARVGPAPAARPAGKGADVSSAPEAGARAQQAGLAPDASSKTPVDVLVDSGKVTREEGAALNNAMRGVDAFERGLATRVAIEHSLTPALWRSFSTLVPPADEDMAKLRPLLATGIVRESEFGWLHDALAGQKGDMEKMLAHQVVDEKAISPDQWRKQTELYPQARLDPLMEKVKPLIAAGTLIPAEGQWIRAALAGEKNEAEKKLASQLIDEKSSTPGKWRAKTAFSYLLKNDAAIDPDHLPPAIDLPLSLTVVMRLLRIDRGAFLSGSPKEEIGRRPNELLPTEVAIERPFYIAIYEVTQSEYTSVMPRNPSFWRGHPDWPIDQVDWQSIAGNNGYLARLNILLAGRYGGTLEADLPTEEEWEYACRAGTETSFNNGKNITDLDVDAGLDPLANYNRDYNGSPCSVGSYQPNNWGLYDMHGNVAEWCKNRYQRGGSWQSNAASCRAAWRTQISAEASASNQVGFRLVLHYKATATPPGQ
jgi:formylglycine-generating enzyme required for sulfatase activity